MTVLENIKLCDNGYRELLEIRTAQKIKLRNASYSTISARYNASTGKTAVMQDIPSATDIEITSVIAINPVVAEMVNLLEIQGRIQSVGHKALKVKPVMYDNMKKNSTSDRDIAIAVEQAQPTQETPIAEFVTESDKNDSLPAQNDKFKVSRNGSTAAKVEKYLEPSQPLDASLDEKSVNSTIDLDQASKEEKTISPVVIEEENSRPVSRTVPLVTPERNISEPQEQKIEESKHVDGIENILDIANITNLEVLREYLAKTAQLKAAAERAKMEEEAAKESAARAEQEAANSRDQLVKTAERIAAHQETLIAQTEQSHNQASIYDAKRGEFEAERDEYQKAINDMLAIMDDKPQESKTRVL